MGLYGSAGEKKRMKIERERERETEWRDEEDTAVQSTKWKKGVLCRVVAT